MDNVHKRAIDLIGKAINGLHYLLRCPQRRVYQFLAKHCNGSRYFAERAIKAPALFHRNAQIRYDFTQIVDQVIH